MSRAFLSPALKSPPVLCYLLLLACEVRRQLILVVSAKAVNIIQARSSPIIVLLINTLCFCFYFSCAAFSTVCFAHFGALFFLLLNDNRVFFLVPQY